MILEHLKAILESRAQNDMVKIQAIDNWCHDYFSQNTSQPAEYQDFLHLVKSYLYLKDEEGNNLCHLLASSGYDKALQDVIEYDPNLVFQANHMGRYPIHTAILNNQLSCAQCLLSIPLVSTLEDVNYRSSIHYAALYGTEEMMELCCKHALDLEMMDTSGKTAIQLAIEADNNDAKTVLERHGIRLESVSYPR